LPGLGSSKRNVAMYAGGIPYAKLRPVMAGCAGLAAMGLAA
jgi:hypothetical protein